MKFLESIVFLLCGWGMLWSQSTKPNIIFIMADDLGYADVGAFGQVDIKTPHLDKMAQEGMKLTQFYTGTPVCGPARCNLMTGMNAGHCRIRNNNENNNLRDEDVTVAEVLKFSGYVTGGFGKWGLGNHDSTGVPYKQGFDHFFGYWDQTHAHNFYSTYLVDDRDTIKLSNINPNEGSRGQGDAPASGEKEYTHSVIAQKALDFIDTYKDSTFFMYVPFTIPHINNEGSGAVDGGFEVPSLGQYASQTNWTTPMKSIAAMITLMDEDVGRIISKLKEHGIDNNTIVFFTSDNGPTFLKIGPNQLPDGTPLSSEERIVANWFNSNGPFLGYKQDTFEGGLRMPTIVRWPGVIAAGSESDQAGYFPDIFPTLAALGGVSVPSNLDGVSLVPTLIGRPQDQVQHEQFFWRLASDFAVLKGDWKLVIETVAGIKDTMLFDVRNDPGEQSDLRAQNPVLVQELLNIMTQEDGATVVADWVPKLVDPAVVSTTSSESRVEQPVVKMEGRVLSVQFSRVGNYIIEMRDTKGNKVYQESTEFTSQVQRAFHQLSSGIYWITLKSQNQKWVQKQIMI